jgi:hypothetical protein
VAFRGGRVIVRSDIAAAVTMTVTVNGIPIPVAGYETQPATPAAFDAWPIWVSSAWRNGCVIESEWRVVVVLPAGAPEAWSEAADAVNEQIGTALYNQGIGMVTRSEPVQLLLAENQPVPMCQFTFTT